MPLKTALIATILTVATIGTASAGHLHRHGHYGAATVNKHVGAGGGAAHRSVTVNGAAGGSAAVDGACAEGQGCSRTWSRTLRNGATAQGSATAERTEDGIVIERTGSGFRGRKW